MAMGVGVRSLGFLAMSCQFVAYIDGTLVEGVEGWSVGGGREKGDPSWCFGCQWGEVEKRATLLGALDTLGREGGGETQTSIIVL